MKIKKNNKCRICQYYQKEEAYKQLKCCQIELQQAQTTISLLQKRVEDESQAYGKRFGIYQVYGPHV